MLLKGNRDSRFEKLEHALSRKSHTTVLEVDLDAMTHNLNYFRSHLRPGVRLVAMVKAASYGAGDFEVAQLLQHQGVDYLAVAFADEGVLLRGRGVTVPVVVLTAGAGSFDAMAANRLEPEIYSLRSLHEFAAAVERYGEQRYPIHVKLDTGMHRLGFVEEEVPALLDALARCGRTVRVASVFAHLCTSDDPAQADFTRPVNFLSQRTQSIALFERLADEMRRRAADASQVVVHDTLCRQVSNREQHLTDLSGRFDAVVFVCGRKSSNGKVLSEVCRRANPRTHVVEEASEIDPAWFEGAATVGICGATSTPKWLMQDVADAIGNLNSEFRIQNS